MCRKKIWIQEAIELHYQYFVQRDNIVGVPGLSSLKKIIAAIRILTNGVVIDVVDEYLRLGKSTTIESLKIFVKAKVEIFGNEYMRKPNDNYIQRLMVVVEQRGFPRMLGSINCMHWKWKNWPTTWRGIYTSHVNEPTIILEAIASHDLWIWHSIFGLQSSLNDINVLDRFDLFSQLAEGRRPRLSHTINNHEYNIGYIMLMAYTLHGLLLRKQFRLFKGTSKKISHLPKN